LEELVMSDVVAGPGVDGYDEEPTDADLDAIEREWPVIEAELELLDAEIAVLVAGALVSSLDRRRVRRAIRRLLVARLALDMPADDGKGAA
jgi:hypothetical protein